MTHDVKDCGLFLTALVAFLQEIQAELPTLVLLDDLCSLGEWQASAIDDKGELIGCVRVGNAPSQCVVKQQKVTGAPLFEMASCQSTLDSSAQPAECEIGTIGIELSKVVPVFTFGILFRRANCVAQLDFVHRDDKPSAPAATVTEIFSKREDLLRVPITIRIAWSKSPVVLVNHGHSPK